MSKRLLSAALITGLSVAAFAPNAAHAVDGTITFSGKISANTCTVGSSVNGVAGASSFTVTLPTVNAAALGSANTVAGTTPFAIALTSCSAGMTSVKAYFEPTSAINGSGRLASGVAGVDLQLLNDSGTAINLNTQANATSATVVSTKATLNYSVQYYNNGAGSVGTGLVSVPLSYSIVYQ